MRRTIVSLLVLLPVAPVAAAGAQSSAAFLLVRGSDTISVERFSRAHDRVESELLFSAAGSRTNFTLSLRPDATVAELKSDFRQAGAARDSRPAQSAVIRFVGDSAIADITTGDRTVTQRLGSRAGAIPFINPSFVLTEQVIHRAFVLGGDSVDVPGFIVAGGQTVPFTVVRHGADSVVVRVAGTPTLAKVSRSGDILGGSVPSQGLRIVRVNSLAEGALSVAPPDYSAPPGAPYSAEDVRIPTPRGYALAGTLTLPRDAARPLPAVVTITGSGQQDRDEAIPMVRGYGLFRQVADTLSRHGVAVLRMDDRGFGASGGNAAGATSADLADDIRAAVAWLRARPEIDPRRIGLVGHSEGGLIAPMIAADDTLLRGIVLMAGPAWTGRRIIEYQNRYLLEHSPQVKAAARDSLLRESMSMVDSSASRAAWVKYFMAYDPLPVARRVRVPTLILQGETDRQVTPEQAAELAAAMRAGGNRDVTERTFPETNHLFLADPDGNPVNYGTLPTRTVRREVLATLVDWITQRFHSPSTGGAAAPRGDAGAGISFGAR